jgi:glyoxylase-like metal-dependent hydrolase (beta-lactamase superfamily II)
MGVVLIDTGFLSSGAVDLVERAERATGKKVVEAIVLHANPDKFNGTAVLQARGVRVVTSAPVAALIPAVHAKRVGWFGKRYAPDYPIEAATPDVFGDATTADRSGRGVIDGACLGRGVQRGACGGDVRWASLRG